MVEPVEGKEYQLQIIIFTNCKVNCKADLDNVTFLKILDFLYTEYVYLFGVLCRIQHCTGHII